ncbi:MAG: hypothetical protein MJZ34_09205 [Paludibacteraceae bacterium]|nr:hypothetical protein [Paludibacteraceae bacterium]
MKKIFSVMTTLVVLAMSLVFTSCDKEEDLYGTWKETGTVEEGVDGVYIHFAEDGYYYIFTDYSNDTWYINRYQYTFKAGYLKVNTIFNLGTVDYTLDIDDDEITIGWDEGSKVYKRCDKPAYLDEAIKSVEEKYGK